MKETAEVEAAAEKTLEKTRRSRSIHRKGPVNDFVESGDGKEGGNEGGNDGSCHEGASSERRAQLDMFLGEYDC